MFNIKLEEKSHKMSFKALPVKVADMVKKNSYYANIKNGVNGAFLGRKSTLLSFILNLYVSPF